MFPTVGNFNNVTMNGTPQLTSAAIAPFTVIDDSGTGAGWHVTLLVPDFTSGGNVLPAAGVQMNAVVVAPGNADSAMGGVWSDPNVDFTTAKTIVEADPADTDPQRRCAARPRRRDQGGGRRYLPGVAADPEAHRPGERARRCVHHDGDDCHRERSLSADEVWLGSAGSDRIQV